MLNKIKPFFHYGNHKTFTFLLIKPMLNFKIKSLTHCNNLSFNLEHCNGIKALMLTLL